MDNCHTPYVTSPTATHLLATQGDYEEAEALYKRSLAIREKLLGPDDLKIATDLKNLATLLWCSQVRVVGFSGKSARSMFLVVWSKMDYHRASFFSP